MPSYNSYPPAHDLADVDEPAIDINEWIYMTWSRMDRDNSGCISREEMDCEEFHNILRAALVPDGGPGFGGPGYARAQVDMNQAISFCLRKADLNKDRTLSFDEFKAFVLCLRNPQLALHTANLIFALFDTNRDQSVDESEFREIYRFYMGRTPAENEFQAEWARLDVRQEGKVGREDYLKWLQASENPVFRLHGPASTPNLLGISSTDPRESSSPSGSLTFTHESQRRPSRELATTSKPWRPWHHYTHLCWAKVPQAKQAKREIMSAPANLKTRMEDNLLCQTDNDMPRWNQRLATANMNWVSDTSGKPRRHKYNRTYFSRYQSQSLPELRPPRRRFVHSYENEKAGPELLPTRRFTAGYQQNRKTGKPEK